MIIISIPASQIVEIVPRLLTAGATDLEINGLLYTKNTLIPASSVVLEFASAQAAGNFFGLTSDEYNLALVYFAGYQNSFTKPKRMMIARRIDAPIAAELVGGRFNNTLATLQAINNGSISLTVNGTAAVVTAADFTAALSLSDVAAELQDALATAGATDVSVVYSSQTGGFTITNATLGDTSTLSYATDGDTGIGLATLLNLSQEGGAILSQGVSALSVADNMAKVRAVTDNWVTFTTLWEAEADEMLQFAQWASGMGVQYLYLPWSDDPTLLQQVETVSPAYVLKQANVGSTALQYDSAAESAFIMGAAASIDWNRLNSVITFAFKSQAGLAANVEDENDALVLLGKTVNFRGNYATRNDNFIFQYQGAMFGDYGFIDPYINAVWFNNVLQASIMNGLTQAGRVPYNDTGYAKIEAWLMDPVIRAKRCGVIDPGVVLSESQKAELISEAGRDISEELWTNGYVVQIEDPGAQVRVTRSSPVCSIWYTYSGSVHKITVASTAIV